MIGIDDGVFMMCFLEVVVIGGGIVGLLIVYVLWEQGVWVCLYEVGLFGMGQFVGELWIFWYVYDDL